MSAVADAAECVSQEQIRGWVADLASDDFAVRDAATENLVAAHAAAMDAILKAKESDDFEVSARAEEIRQRIAQRAIEVLSQRRAKFNPRNSFDPTEIVWGKHKFTEDDMIQIGWAKSPRQRAPDMHPRPMLIRDLNPENIDFLWMQSAKSRCKKTAPSNSSLRVSCRTIVICFSLAAGTF